MHEFNAAKHRQPRPWVWLALGAGLCLGLAGAACGVEAPSGEAPSSASVDAAPSSPSFESGLTIPETQLETGPESALLPGADDPAAGEEAGDEKQQRGREPGY